MDIIQYPQKGLQSEKLGPGGVGYDSPFLGSPWPSRPFPATPQHVPAKIVATSGRPASPTMKALNPEGRGQKGTSEDGVSFFWCQTLAL